MLALKLAYRNLMGAGLRTWLNVTVLSLAYVIIIWHQGLFIGMLRQSIRAMTDDAIGGGQYWHENYDPYDALSLDDGHGPLPADLETLAQHGDAAPILIRQAAIYPEGRIQLVLLKGIDPSQKVLGLPTTALEAGSDDELPILIGKRMAAGNSLTVGDRVTLRWRDANGTFDAREGTIAAVMDTSVPAVDQRQLWVSLDTLRKMTSLPGEATLVVLGPGQTPPPASAAWRFQSPDVLLKDLYDMVRTKRVGSGIMYSILLLLAMLAIFDTQVLAIFRRRREIGTLVALGMTRRQVVGLFTLEGAAHGVLAALVGAVYGLPLLIYTARHGIGLPESTDDAGFALPETMYPAYSAGLVLFTLALVMSTVTIVSYWPSRRIAGMNPTDAIRGKAT